MFESVEEVDQIESEPKSEDAKQVSKISNGAPQNGTSSPDSGLPSSRNFSVTSGHSDSLSTEDSGIHDPSLKAQPQLAVSKERFASSSGEEGKVTEEGETKSIEKLGVKEYSRIEVNKVLSLDAVVTISERSKKDTESLSDKRSEVETEGLKMARDAFETLAAARSHMTKMEVGESPERTLTSENEALTERTESEIPKVTEVKESTRPQQKMNENQVSVDSESTLMGIKDIRAIREEPLVTNDHKVSDAVERKVVADTLVSVSKDDDTEKETNEISKEKTSKTCMDDVKDVSGTQRALKPSDEKENKTMKTSDLPSGAGITVKRKATLVIPKTTGTEQREGKDDSKRSTHKEIQRNAPVIEETVVPLVHEAFSTREMGEAQDATESDESPSAIEMEEILTAKVSMAWGRKSSPKSKANEQAAVPVLELGLEEAHGKTSSEGLDSDEPEMESLYPPLDSLAVNATSPVSSIGTTYSVSMRFREVFLYNNIVNYVIYINLFTIVIAARAFGPVHSKSASHW